MRQRLTAYTLGQSFSSSSSVHAQTTTNRQRKSRSPYVVLQLKTSASVNEIKAAFRRLAKKNHPDLNPHLRQSSNGERNGKGSASYFYDPMAELIDAYNKLLDDDFSDRVRDSRVSLDCEIYSIDELKINPMYDVYSIRILYNNSEDPTVPTMTASNFIARDGLDFIPAPEAVIEVPAHPDDSVSDLKRRIQDMYAKEWLLTGRKTDRDKLMTGWELVSNGSVLSYHLFLHSYNIKCNDAIHAVVRKYVDVEYE